MPLDLKEPRKGKSPNWSIRGTYLGVRVDKSCGTPKRSVAARILAELEGKIERGEWPPKKKEPTAGRAETFIEAANLYLAAGKRKRYVRKLILYFGETPIPDIDQAAIDDAAKAICPNAGAGQRNAAVYTPVGAIIRHAGHELKMKRPKGAKGNVKTDWLQPIDAFAIIAAADRVQPRFGVLLRFLLYTGMRVSEPLRLTWSDLSLEEGGAWMRRSKGGKTGAVMLHKDLRDALATLPREDGGRVFPYAYGGHMKHLLMRSKLGALALPCPVRRPIGWRAPPNRFAFVGFHTWRHTWATWMRRYAKVDVQGLVATENWSDERSARRYAHAVARDEWARVEDLPSMTATRGKSVESDHGSN